MHRRILAVAIVLLTSALSAPASADPVAPATAGTALPPLPPPAPTPSGLVVLALVGATDAAWPLAQAVYGTPAVRPAAIDDAHARVLCAERAPDGAGPELHDLADTVGAIHGDDAPSRALLGDVARRFAVRGVVVVAVDAGRPTARVFLPATGAFDAATYAPDAAPNIAWSGAIASLAHSFGSPDAAAPPTPPSRAPSLATHEGPELDNAPPKPRQFYQSGWFWGALGAAAFAAGAVFLATRDNGTSTIHLQMQVPH